MTDLRGGLTVAEWKDACTTKLGLTLIPNSKGIYGGTCPFCGAQKSFFVWLWTRRSFSCENCETKGKIKIRIRE
jgi:hypothetical protein